MHDSLAKSGSAGSQLWIIPKGILTGLPGLRGQHSGVSFSMLEHFFAVHHDST
jgi:hypothetical protein